jgi:DNA-binding beta-propeller fold protein YncE
LIGNVYIASSRILGAMLIAILSVFIFSNINFFSFGIDDFSNGARIGNVSFSYPDDWKISQGDESVTLKPSENVTANITISFTSVASISSNTNSLLEDFVDENFSEPEFRKFMTINGYPVYRLDETIDNTKNTYFVMIKDDVAYVFKSSILYDQEFYNYSSLAYQIFESLLTNLSHQGPLQNVGLDVYKIKDIEVNPNNNKIYVIRNGENDTIVFDGNNNQILRNISFPGHPISMVVTPLNNFLYVLSSSNSSGYIITIVDSLSDSVITTIPLYKLAVIDHLSNTTIENLTVLEGTILFDVSAANTIYITSGEEEFLYVIQACDPEISREECIEFLSSPGLRTGEECMEFMSELCIERTHIGYDSRVILTNKYVDDRKLYLLKN